MLPCSLLFPALLAQTPIQFDAPQVQIDHTVAPFRRLIDLDGDPYPDAVGAWVNSNNSQFKVNVYRNDGTGRLESVWSDPSVIPGLPSAGNSPELQIEVADLDGDGDQDFCAVLGYHVYDFLLEPNLAVPTKLDTSFSGVFGLGLRDLDGDGAADHVMSHVFDVAINLSGQASEFSVVHDLYDSPVVLDESANVTVRFADGDGDGDTDVLLLTSKRFQWLYLDADGEPVAIGPRQELGFDHAMGDVGDVDGDGDLDAVFFDMGGTFRVLRQGPGGSFTLEPAAVGGPAEFLMDVDGDGHLDGVCCGGSGGTPPFEENLLESNFEIALGDGNGGFAPAVTRAGLGSPQLAGVADMDGDGTLDVVAGRVVWFGASESVGQLQPATAATEARLVTDADMDGDPDFGLGLDAALLNQGDGRFVSLAPTVGGTPPGVSYVGPGYCGDLDGDGDPDLLVEAWSGGALLGMHRLENAGGGHLVDAGLASAAGVSFSLGSLETVDGMFADVDGDGTVDLVTRSPFGVDQSAVWLQGPGGVFAQDQLLDGYRAAALADFDKDGAIDLLVFESQAFSDRLQMMVGGPGGFALDESILSGSGWSFSASVVGKVAVVDLQGTGYPDIALAASNLVLLRNRIPVDGVFAFTGTSDFSAQLAPSARVFAGDVDGNGFNDLVYGPWVNAPRALAVDLNQGGGWFQVYEQQLLVQEATPLVDLDGDGDLDLAGSVMARGLAVGFDGAGLRQQYGAATPGSDGARPTLGASGPFTVGDAPQLRITGGLGGTLAALAVGFVPAALADFPVVGVTSLVDPFAPGLVVVPIATDGGAGAPGAGGWTLDYTVVPGFSALTAYHQGFLFDPGAPGSFAATNGLRLTYAP